MSHYAGYIEGYYGRELTWEQRFALLDHLHALGMNAFLYAPKEDPFHRVQWRKPYPVSWHKKLKAFAARGKRKKVAVIPALAPGLSYDYCSRRDYALLFAKFSRYFAMGINTVALLMDDIPRSLPAHCAYAFSSLGHAHGALLKRLHNDLRKINPAVQLWFCPTIYTDEFVTGKAVDCVYIQDLVRTMPRSVTLMWTGPQVVSEKINHQTCGALVKLFKGNVVFWDNLYANDYAPYRLFIGPFLGREARLIRNTRGILINPTGLFHTDKFLLSLFADFLRKKKATTAGWERVAGEYDVSKNFYRIRKFFWSPFMIPAKKDLSQESITTYCSLQDELLVLWQNPLKLEWHPYIYGFLQDCSYYDIPKAKLKSWLYNQYSPIVAQRMARR